MRRLWKEGIAVVSILGKFHTSSSKMEVLWFLSRLGQFNLNHWNASLLTSLAISFTPNWEMRAALQALFSQPAIQKWLAGLAHMCLAILQRWKAGGWALWYVTFLSTFWTVNNLILPPSLRLPPLFLRTKHLCTYTYTHICRRDTYVCVYVTTWRDTSLGGQRCTANRLVCCLTTSTLLYLAMQAMHLQSLHNRIQFHYLTTMHS